MTTWTVNHVNAHYVWHVQVDTDHATGESNTEPEALRQVAWAIDWLTGSTTMTGSHPHNQRPTNN